MISKFFKLYKIRKSRTVKTVDLSDIHKTCNLDFEINLVQQKVASDHQISY